MGSGGFGWISWVRSVGVGSVVVCRGKGWAYGRVLNGEAFE